MYKTLKNNFIVGYFNNGPVLNELYSKNIDICLVAYAIFLFFFI